jgi:Ca2+-binding RTX toxin-like protein
MRRVMLVMAAVAMMVSLFAVVAYAAEIQGTDNTEFLFESDLNDTIAAHRGDDKIDADNYGNDKDWIKGNRNNDTIWAKDGDTKDILNGGKGNDTCYGDAQVVPFPSDEFKSCEVINPP